KLLEGNEKGSSGTGGSHASMFFGAGGGVGDVPTNNRAMIALWETAKTTQPTPQQPSSASQSLRRPFGCAVLPFGTLLQTAAVTQGAPSSVPGAAPIAAASTVHPLAMPSSSQKDLPPSEHFMPIFVPSSESTYAALH